MSCPNCKIFHSECKAICCGMVPIPEQVLRDHNDKMQRPITSVLQCKTEDGEDTGTFLPKTADMNCVFLKADLSCAIYEIRPDVCRKFGDESHILMTCRFQTRAGERRNNLGRQMTDKRVEKYFQKVREGKPR